MFLIILVLFKGYIYKYSKYILIFLLLFIFNKIDFSLLLDKRYIGCFYSLGNFLV